MATANQPLTLAAEEDSGAKILFLFNPTTVSSFTLWFGVAGILVCRALPFLDARLSLPVAAVCGILGTQATVKLLGTIAGRLFASGSFSQESLIGLQAEVTVPVNAGRTGEITCVAGGPRYTCPARTLNSAASFKRGALVIISDVRDDVAFIEPWPDDFAELEAKGTILEAKGTILDANVVKHPDNS
jgi:hypothetical protein